MSDAFYGEIRIFTYTFAPLDWAYCDGATVLVPQAQALYAIIGNMYGGTVNQNFKLPNLQGMVPIGQGSGPGLTPRKIAAPGGGATNTLLSSQLPPHNHQLNVAYSGSDLTGLPSATTVPSCENTNLNTFIDTPGNAYLSPAALTGAGASQPHQNQQPFLALSFCICVQNGVWPERP